MNTLPPTIEDRDTLDLLCRSLAVRHSSYDDQDLRLAFFSESFSWNALIELAIAHNLVVPLIACLNARGLLLPKPRNAGDEAIKNHPTVLLEDVFARHMERQGDLRGQLWTISAAFNEHGIVPLALKGARYLLPDAPAWAEARSMNDIDLLVPDEMARLASEILFGLGYRSLPALSMTDHHLTPMMRVGCHGSIELHTMPLSQDARSVLSTEEVWSSSEVHSLGKARLRALRPGWQMLLGFLHYQLGHRNHRRHVLALKGLWEFACEAHWLSDEDWEEIGGHIDSPDSREAFGEWLALAEQLYCLTPPPALPVSTTDRENALTTMLWARKPTWIRRAHFFRDVLKFAFSKTRLAARYNCEPNGLMLGIRIRHLFFLIARHSWLQLTRAFTRSPSSQ